MKPRRTTLLEVVSAGLMVFLTAAFGAGLPAQQAPGGSESGNGSSPPPGDNTEAAQTAARVSQIATYLVEVGIDPTVARETVQRDPRVAVELYARWLLIGGPFIRGDANSDGTVDISDGVRLVTFLFTGARDLDCRKAGDVNGDGGLDVSDAVTIFSFLFLGGDPPAAPFPGCGSDWGPPEEGCSAQGTCASPAADVNACARAYLDGVGEHCGNIPYSKAMPCLIEQAAQATTCMRYAVLGR